MSTKKSEKCTYSSTQPFELAVRELITQLDSLFYGVVEGWTLLNNSRLELELNEKSGNLHIIIRPCCWPRASYIRAYFIQERDEWQAYEGYVNACHIDFQLTFRVSINSPNVIKSIDINTKEAQLLASIS